ncbi:hypothetical protein M885DRAFT_499762 [Pelagophyceae sp. CCMP2097]|nr:hypothetical protein M885DRAFT_499762 [Pelagophyceae sp. CCMP2097]
MAFSRFQGKVETMSLALPMLNACLNLRTVSGEPLEGYAVMTAPHRAHPGGGRGVAALRTYRAGDVVINRAEPLAHSSRFLPPPLALAPADHVAVRARVEATLADWAPRLEDDGRKFPWIAAQAAARLAHEPNGSASAYGLVLTALHIAPQVADQPQQLVADFEALCAAACGAKGTAFLTEAWYAALTARLHVATRDIDEGQELTISYVREDQFDDEAARRAFLRDNYGFEEQGTAEEQASSKGEA